MTDKTYCKCKKCGYEKAEVDMNNCIRLDCMPPIYKHRYKCPECGDVGLVCTEDIYGIATIKKAEPNTYRESNCMICGKTVERTFGEPAICDECKEAIKWAKEEKKIKETKEIDATHLDTNKLTAEWFEEKYKSDLATWEAEKYKCGAYRDSDNFYAHLEEHCTKLAKENAELRKENLDLKIALAREDDRRKKNIGKNHE